VTAASTAPPHHAAATILAFDFGARRIGVAVGHGMTARGEPLATLPNLGKTRALAAIAPWVEEWQPSLLVVGQPQHADGSAHPVAAAARTFAKALCTAFSRPTVLVNETLSSHTAAERLRDAPKREAALGVDAMAAAIIAETYFSAPEMATPAP
jgi:putative holliday junction resolvase